MGDPGESSRRLLRNSSPVARFAARAALYALLTVALLPWVTYPPVFRACGNVLFGRWGEGRVARFERFDDVLGVRDTIIRVGRQEAGQEQFLASVGVNSVREGYVPLAVIAILALATPISWRRRRRLLGIGLALAQLFVLGRISITILHGLSRTRFGDRTLIQVSSQTAWLLRRAEQIFATDLHMTYLAPLLIWVALMVRLGHLSGLRVDRVVD
jgi:hypothetical protein